MPAHRVSSVGRIALCGVLSAQLILGQRPWFVGGDFSPPLAFAATQAEGGPTPQPSGAAPADMIKSDIASGFDYGVNTNSGAFGSSIPITTPPGRLGIEPKLALSYSSSSSAPGIAGVGWNLALPSVRVDPNVPILTTTRYQLDGQRLIEDPAVPGTFATEQDTYARIRRTCVSSNCAFTVDERSGVRMRFGANADSELLGRWALDRVEDAHGNYMTISYMTDAELLGLFGADNARDGALLPREIRYTGSADRAPWYTVRFAYELRPASDSYDFAPDWGSGRLRYRLKTVSVVGGDNVTIRSHALSYVQAANGRSLLANVAVTGLAGAAGPRPFAMTYVQAPTGFTAPTALEVPALDSRVVTGDFNGDGRADLLTYRRTDPSGLLLHRWRVQLGHSTGLGAQAIWLTAHAYNYPATATTPGGCTGAADKVFVGDWDADGDSDLFHYAAGCGVAPRWRVLVAQYDHFDVVDWVPAAQTGWGSVYDANSATLVFADFTGDGRSDALVHRGLQSTLVESAASAPGFVTRPANPGVTGPLLSTGDMNGDRMTDLAIYDSTKITVACSEGGGSFYPCGGTGVPLPAGSRPLTGDFNGDGLTDVLVNGSAASTVYTSTRLGFRARAVTIPLISDVADVDGDGRDDLLQTITTATNTWSLRTHLGRGSVFLPGATLGYPDLAMGSVPSCAPYTYSPQTLVADFTGDGRADPILRTRDPSGGFCAVSGAQFLATATDAPAVDRLASIQSPTGLTLQALYQRSTNPGLPISLPVVKELWIRDFPRVYFNRPISPILETHRYTFLSGKWDPARAEFMGFAQGWDELVERNLTEKVTYFQDTARRGKPSSSLKARTSPYEILSSDHYVYRDDLAAPYRTEVAWHLKRYWAAGAITVSALQGFQYDAAGNLTRLDDHGLCSTTADDRHTITTHRAATDFNVHRMAQQSLYQGAAAPPPELGGTSGGCTGTTTTSLVESTYNEYDGTAASVTRGDLTRSYRLVIAANGSQSWLRERDYTYRADGLPSSITDARGFVTSIMSYDPVLGMYPERVRNAVGHEEVREYEPHFGKLSRVTEPNGGARTMQYDAFGRKRALRTPLAASLWMNTVTWAYGDTLPNWTATVMPFQAAGGAMQGSASVDFRDALGRTIATVRDGDSHQERVLANRTTYWAATEIPATVLAPVEVTVTACGSVLTCLASWATSQPALVDWQTLTTAPGVAVQFAVDPLGRVTRRDNPDGSFVTYAHSVDASGFGLVAFDEVGDQRRLYRDVHGELTRVERWGQAAAQPAITSYQRDVRGKLTGITSPLGVTTQLTWSSLGRLERVVSPELGTLTLGYDNSGNEISRTDARGAVTTTTVDALGRPTYRSTSDGGSTLWVYDRDPLCIFSCASPAVADNTLGRPWAVIDAAGLATFAYDADGHLAREARTIGSTQHTTRYETWTTGQLVRKTYPDGEVHSFAMAPDGQQRSLVIGAATTPTVTMNRDALGRPSSLTYASGATTQYTVNPQTQRIEEISMKQANGVVAQKLTYSFHPDGLVSAMSRSDALGGDESLYLTHDGDKRITDVFVAPDVTTAAEHYDYDADGRMIARKDRGGAQVSVAHADPQHPNAVTAVGARGFSYDAAGNRVEERAGTTVTRTLGYDGLGRLTSVNGGQARYDHDAQGRRVNEHLAGGTRTTLGAYTLEPDGSTRKALQLGTTRVGERSSVAGDRFFHVDGSGSVIGESNASGVLDTSRTFSAFGATVQEDRAASASRLGFGGYPLDSATGMYFASARYYDPSTASFTQPDSWLYGFDNPEVLNGYAYAANSPYQYNDPTGHFVWAAFIVAGLITFAVGMALDIQAADGDPDWSTIIIKNLLLGAVNGAAFGVTGWGTFAMGTWKQALILGGIRGALLAGATAAWQQHETGRHADVGFVLGYGFLVGALGGLIPDPSGGNFAEFLLLSIGASLYQTFASRIILHESPTAETRPGYRLDAPSAPQTPPPSCGRDAEATTLPLPCELAVQ